MHPYQFFFFPFSVCYCLKTTLNRKQDEVGQADGEMLVMGRPPKQGEEMESLRYVTGSSFRLQASGETAVCIF